MPSPTYRVRRATLDDLGPLTELWKSMHLPVEDLARRVTEFQVAESAEGTFLGAVGVQIAERQGLVHSEGFTDFGVSQTLRQLMWERVQALATNHGLWRIWTQEQAPFWRQCGLAAADAEALEKLPVAWRNQPPAWLTIKLKEDVDALMALDPEFALLMDAQKQRTARMMQQARLLKTCATVLAVGLFVLVVGAAFYIARKNPHLLHH
jgi:N-acetylglutamate synthase-like GNAT family acetyltransferase